MADDSVLPQHRVVRIVAGQDRRQFSLFLGAGASKSSGVPLAGEMIAEWRREAFVDAHPEVSDPDQATIDDWCSGQSFAADPDYEYSALFERQYHNRSLRQKYIERKVEPAFPSWGYLFLANIMRAGYFNITYTTNFDDLINDALTVYLGYNPVVCAVDSEVESINPTTDRVKVIKLHGDYLFDHIKNTQGELENLTPNMQRKFEEFSRHRGLVVIGYAGRDRSVMGVLEGLLASNDGYFPTDVYWSVRDGEDASAPVASLRDRFRDRFHLFRCNDFDAFAAQLHAELDLRKPESIEAPVQTLKAKFEALTRLGGREVHPLIAEYRTALEGKFASPYAKAEGLPRLKLLEAQLLVAQRDYEAALERVAEYETETGSQDAHSLSVAGAALAIQAEETGDTAASAAAIERYLRAVEIDPQAIPPRRALIPLFSLQHRTHDAIAQSEALLRLTPNDKYLRLGVAGFYLREHRFDDALAQADYLIGREPDDSAINGFRAEVLAACGRSDEAVAQAERAVGLDPDNVWFRIGYSNILFQAGRPDAAEVQTREAMRIEPRNPRAWQQLCMLLAALNRIPEMQAALMQLRTLSPALAHSLEVNMQRNMARQHHMMMQQARAAMPWQGNVHQPWGPPPDQSGEPGHSDSPWDKWRKLFK